MKLLLFLSLFVYFTFACVLPQQRNERKGMQFARQTYPGMDQLGGLRDLRRKKNVPIIGYGPFKEQRHQLEDRGYDLGYVLGTGYGEKLGDGIKTGISKSIWKGLNEEAQGQERGGGGKKKRKQKEEP